MNIVKSDTARSYRFNEGILLLNGGLMAVANRLASPQMVLPWVYSMIGGPLFLVGLIVPTIRLGALLAQLAIIPTLLARKTRKWANVIASVVLSLFLLLICIATLELSVVTAMTVFFITTLVLGICNGILALTSTEVMAKTVPRDRIGRLLAVQASIGGLLTLLLVAGLMYVFPDDGSKSQHLVLIVAAAVTTLIAGLAFAMIREPASKVQPPRSVWAETKIGWQLCNQTDWFRDYLKTRVLFLSVGLATPFYSIHVATSYQSDVQSLSIFVVASGLTTMFSGAIWSKLLTRDPRRVLALAGWLAAAAGAVAVIEAMFASLTMQVMYVAVFSLLQLAVQGMTQSVKTYLTLKAPEQDRPRILAINNALLGVMAVFVSFLIGVIAHTSHIYAALGLLIVLAIWASIRATRLEPAEIQLSNIETDEEDHDR